MRKSLIILLALFATLAISVSVFAHSGGTDSNGGHHDGDDYHYHHGYPAHDHTDMDGDGDLDCPYNFKDNTDRNHSSSGSPSVNGNVSSGTANPPTASDNSLNSSKAPQSSSGGSVFKEYLSALFADTEAVIILSIFRVYFRRRFLDHQRSFCNSFAPISIAVLSLSKAVQIPILP